MDFLKSTPLETVSKGVTERGGEGFGHMLVRTGADGRIDPSLLSVESAANVAGMSWYRITADDIGFGYDPKSGTAAFTVRLPEACCTLDLSLLETVANSGRGVQLRAGGPYWCETNVGAASPAETGYRYTWGSKSSLRGPAAVGSDTELVDPSGSPFGGVAALVDSPDAAYPDLLSRTPEALLADGVCVTAASGEVVLSADYDCASEMGDGWRMPTAGELEELTASAFETVTEGGVSVLRIRSAAGSGHIDLPAAALSDDGTVRVVMTYMSGTPRLAGSGSEAAAMSADPKHPAPSSVSRFSKESPMASVGLVRAVRDPVDLSGTRYSITYVNDGGDSTHLLLAGTGGGGELRTVTVSSSTGTFSEREPTSDDILAAAAKSTAGVIAAGTGSGLVFVSPGAKAGDGSQSRPFGSLSEAVEAGARVVTLLPGDYAGETVSLQAGGALVVVGSGEASRLQSLVVPRGTVHMYGVLADSVEVTEYATVSLWSSRITRMSGRAARVLLNDMGSAVDVVTVTDADIRYTGTRSVYSAERLVDGVNTLTISGLPAYNGRTLAFAEDYTAMNVAISGNSEAIAELREKLDAIDTGPDPSLSAIMTTVRSLGSRMDSLEESVTAKLSGQTSTISSLYSMIGAVRDGVSDNSSSIAALRSDVDANSAAIRSIDGRVAAGEVKMSEFSKKVETVLRALSAAGLPGAVGPGDTDTSVQFGTVVVDELPEPSEAHKNKLYLVPSAQQASHNVYDEYICVRYENAWRWESVGTTSIDCNSLVPSDEDGVFELGVENSATLAAKVAMMEAGGLTPEGRAALAETIDSRIAAAIGIASRDLQAAIDGVTEG